MDASYKKHQTLTEAGHQLAPLVFPTPPPSDWLTVLSNNYLQVPLKLPTVTAGQYVIQNLEQVWCTHT